jgi:nitrite reductase/ring-hydroxylating ferredoxin subunit
MNPSFEPQHWHELPQAPATGAVLGQMQALTDGEVTLAEIKVLASAEATPFRYLLLKSGDTVQAYVNRCAHFGVPLAQRQDLMIFTPHTSLSCNVHYARYRWADGVCDAGDCKGEALMPIPLDIDAHGTIRVAGKAA